MLRREDFWQRTALLCILSVALLGFGESGRERPEIQRKGSQFDAFWTLPFEGSWRVEDVFGHSCASGQVHIGENSISLPKVASSIDLVLKIARSGSGDPQSFFVPGKVSLSPFPKVEGASVIYQLAPRTYFAKGLGKDKTGTLADLTTARLLELKGLGIDYLWLTGILENASRENTDSDVVKGDAGSYYAITDKWDIAPSLGKLSDFEALIERAHAAQIRVLLDLVANHTARVHRTDVLCKDRLDFGNQDNRDVFFASENNYFYLPDQIFYPPLRPRGSDLDGVFDSDFLRPGLQFELPSRVTGNDIPEARPRLGDWYETVKLNYGRNFLTQEERYDPQPRTWSQVLDVAQYWVQKGVDGFRVDFAHAVPLPFWRYFTTELKKTNPEVFLLAEAYESDQDMKIPGFSYTRLYEAGFDSIYDSNLYWAMYREARQPGNMPNALFSASPAAREDLLTKGYAFTRYMENHDEVRVASDEFLPGFPGAQGRQMRARVGLAYTAYLGLMPGHVMIHGGQEFAEDASVAGEFAGHNGRTSIFDYVYQSQTRAWYFGERTQETVGLRTLYQRLLHLKKRPPFKAVHSTGTPSFIALDQARSHEQQAKWIGAYLRYQESDAYIVVTNSDPFQAHTVTLHLTSRDGQDVWGALAALGIENSGKRYYLRGIFPNEDDRRLGSEAESSGLPGWVMYRSQGVPSGIHLGELPPGTTYVFKLEPL